MRLRKFNESIDSIDISYVEECFIDFIDNYTCDILEKTQPNTGVKYFEIKIVFETLRTNLSKSMTEIEFKESLDKYNKFGDVLNDLNVCIEKLKLKYSDDVLISMDHFNGKEYIEIYLVPIKR